MNFAFRRPRRIRSTPTRAFDGRDPPLVGAFVGPLPALDEVARREAWLATPLDVQVCFEPWADDEDEIAALFADLVTVFDAGRLPLVTWEPFTATPESTPPDLLSQAASGRYDAYLDRWATALRRWLAGPDGRLGTGDDRGLILRPMHEANGDWYPWAPATGGGTPADYVRLWRRLHRSVMREGVTTDHVRWLWAVNHVDAGGITAEELFPGDDVVDLVGVDGFNWGASQPWSAWQPPTAVFGPMLDRLRACSTRPVCVPEFGCSSTVDAPDADEDEAVGTARKSAWLQDAFDYFATADVRLAAYFDVDKETDWAIFDGSAGDNAVTVDATGYRTYSGFRAGVTAFTASQSGPSRNG